MADISDIDSAQSVKIVGSDASGVEQTPVSSNNNGKLNIVELSNNGGAQGAVTVGSTAVEAKAGGSPLNNRISLTIYNNSNSIIYWGYTSAVTIANGTPLQKGQMGVWAVGPGTSVYLVANSAGNDVRVTENA